jgi:uncharacterized protein YcbK (DUF882 family)
VVIAGVVAALGASGLHGAEPARFFIAGTGSLALQNAHSGEQATVRYRLDDGTYDAQALARIARLFRSRADGREAPISLRLIEILSHLQASEGLRPFVVQSGYRSPAYNQALKAKGRQVAGGSLHTEGLAADLAVPRKRLAALWQRVRDLDCCGAGAYAHEGFLHVDVGRPRFWEAATSKVEQNLSAGNARLFARTEFDRYASGEPIAVRVHALTAPPVRIARRGLGIPAGGEPWPITIDGEQVEHDGCFEIGASGAALRIGGTRAVTRVRLRLETCAPRVDATPEVVETNAIEIR